VSCGASPPTFRLLDGYIGWEADLTIANSKKGLEGFDGVEGISLERLHPMAVDPSVLDTYLLPAVLARGCGPCEWYLLKHTCPILLRRDRCAEGFQPVFGTFGHVGSLGLPTAIAARRHRVAIAAGGQHQVWILAAHGQRVLARIPLAHPGPLAFAPWDELFVVDGGRILRFGLGGDLRGAIDLPFARPGRTVDRLGFDSDCGLWVATRTSDELAAKKDPAFELWHAPRLALRARADGAPASDPPFALGAIDDGTLCLLDEASLVAHPVPCFGPFAPATPADLAKAFPKTGLTAVDPWPGAGFCFHERGPDGFDLTLCFDWEGAPLPVGVVRSPGPPERASQGQLLTVAIDSGLPRCRWHRVEVDADLPFGTTLEVAVASAETFDPGGLVYDTPDAQWKGNFPGGRPYPDEWETLPLNAVDALVNQPPGRLIFVRLRLTGDGRATPVVRRVRLDMPRVTSLDRLPAVYRMDPEAEDFSERFLSLFDSSINELDRAIERAPALLDTDHVPDEVLPWLGSFLDVIFDPSWSTTRRRALLAVLPSLYRYRGTVGGLVEAVEKMTGVTVAIEELPLERGWGALTARRDLFRQLPARPPQLPARLRSVRLFGKSRARFRLGSSPLGGAPLRSFGNPDQDPLSALAFRFRVLAPPDPTDLQGFRRRLERAVASQKPAHTLAAVRVGGSGFVLGSWSAVGIDTAFAPLPAPVLGKAGNVRLNRMSLVWPGPGGCRAPLQLGTSSSVGISTVLA
jgi:phage tail-like protein